MELSLSLAADVAEIKKASIVGGGLAGLACGIGLRQAGWDVAVYEKRRYPLKKVCGEFLSPRGWERIQELGADKHLALPPVALPKARFYYSKQAHFDFELAPQAWGISREALDSTLAQRFKDLGGQLHEGEAFDFNKPGDGLLIDASGRASSGSNAKWIGWKGYLPASEIDLDIQGITMLPLDGGYCGLSKVEDGRTSVCFVARAPANVEALLRSHPFLEPLAAKVRFHASIAGFDFIRAPRPWHLGDAAAVWPPLVGDGMSRALGSGMQLAEALQEGREAGASRDFMQFHLSKAMHSLMLFPLGRKLLGPLLNLAPGLAAKAYRASRG